MRRLLLLAALPLFAQSPEARITRLYVFGDSYSDNGAGYIDGNGPTAVAYLAQRLGFELKPSTTGSASQSLNFAVSGAQSGSGEGRKIKEAFLGRGMRNQVDEFVSRVQSQQISFDPKTTLFFIAGGLNDRRLPDGETVSNLESEIRKLYDAGARRFRVAILPTAIPSFSAVGIKLNPGRAISEEDTTPCPKPDAYYFYHEGHPSTAVHKIVGDKLYDEIVSSK
jgi:phospholipase/lecithinase/hemolysin